MDKPITEVDLAVVGAGGVSGAAFLWSLAAATDIKSVVAFEQFATPGAVNSNPLNNAQTSHDGGTETNYSLEKARKVKIAALMLRRYVRSCGNSMLYKKTHRMVLGVGAAEVAELEERQRVFAADYPDLKLVYGGELAHIEPMVMRGRDPAEPVCAQVSDEGYIVNYQLLAQELLEEAKRLNPLLDVHFNTSATHISQRADGRYHIETKQGSWLAKALVCTAGAYSLHFAQSLGYGRDFALLPIAGNFYSAPRVLNGKVYRVQQEGLPFAAPHGDPDILSDSVTRFGPTTKPLPFMERHRWGSIPDFASIWGRASWRGVVSLVKILAAKRILGYAVKQFFFDLPWIGTALFLREVRTIIPTMKYGDLKLRRGAGGIRPQIVDLRSGELIMGSVTIPGYNSLFVTTPSPGASICIAQGKEVAEATVAMFEGQYRFDNDAFEAALDGKARPLLAIVHVN